MSRRRTGAIAIGVGAATAVVLSLAGAKTPVVIGSAAALGIAGGVVAGRIGVNKRISTSEGFNHEQKKVLEQFSEGCKNLEVEDYQGAITVFSKLIVDYPEFCPAYVNRGISEINNNQYEGAINDLSKAIELDENSSIAYLHRGFAKQQTSDYRGACQDWMMSDQVSENGNEDAIKILKDFLQRIESLDENNVVMSNDSLNAIAKEIREYLAEGSCKDENIRIGLKAAPLYQFAKDVDKSEPTQLWFAGMEKAELGDYKGAINDYKKALEIDPNHRYVLNSFGAAEFALGNYDVAISYHSKAIDLDPGLGLPYLYRGNARKEQGDLQGACQDWKEASKYGDSDAGNLLDQHCKRYLTASDFGYLAYQKSSIGDHQGAIEDYLKAIALDPTRSEIYFHLGLNRMLLGDDQQTAIQDFTKAIEINLKYFNAYNMRGQAKKELGRLNDAVMDFNKAIDINSQYPIAFSNRGCTKFELKDFQGAISDHSNAIEIDPKNPNFYFNRANVKREVGDLKGACEDWKKAAELGDEDAALLVEEHCQ